MLNYYYYHSHPRSQHCFRLVVFRVLTIHNVQMANISLSMAFITKVT